MIIDLVVHIDRHSRMRQKISIFSSSEFKDQVFHLRVYRRPVGSMVWSQEFGTQKYLGIKSQVLVPLEPRFQVRFGY